MTLCEFCVLQKPGGGCANGHSVPKKMRCVDFSPGLERFCATPTDYTGRAQLRQMALYFGLAGRELQRVLALAEAGTQVSQFNQSTGPRPETRFP